MPKNVVPKLTGTAQEIKNKGRKSLQTLQISANEQQIAGKSMVLPDDETVPSKKKLLRTVEKLIAVEKENISTLRRSKRKTNVSDLLNYAESPVDPKPSTSVSMKTKKKKTAAKPRKEQATTLKKKQPESILNQTKLNFSPVTSVLSKSSDVSEPVSPGKNILGTSPLEEAEVTDDSGFDSNNGVFSQNPTLSTEASESDAVKSSSAISDEATSILTSIDPPLCYWKDLAEQRRLALEKALHENELIHDQLTVLEAENSQLKQLLNEAEHLAQVVRDIIA